MRRSVGHFLFSVINTPTKLLRGEGLPLAHSPGRTVKGLFTEARRDSTVVAAAAQLVTEQPHREAEDEQKGG